MKKIILLSSIMILSAVWAMAQSDSDSDSESRTTSNKMTVEGCLDGAIGHYTLTDYAGASYRLAGDADTLKAHVGETMQVGIQIMNGQLSARGVKRMPLQSG